MTVTTKKGSAGKLRKQARKIRIRDLYGGGDSGNLLQGRYGTEKIYAWFQNRHRRASRQLDPGGVYHSDEKTQFGDDHDWRVPPTVRECLKRPLVRGQINVRLAWYVTWVSPKTGLRLRKYFESPWAAIHFIATKAQYVDRHTALVSRSHGYDIPSRFRGKVPYKQEREGKKPRTWYWCPQCMQPRRFRAVQPLTDFHGAVKVWNEEKGRYDYPERKLRLLECPHCGCTNRDTVFRRSNQPWEVRKFKRGARRAKRRR